MGAAREGVQKQSKIPVSSGEKRAIWQIIPDFTVFLQSGKTPVCGVSRRFVIQMLFRLMRQLPRKKSRKDCR